MKVAEAKLRMYNVGFGDCFLLVLTYDDPERSKRSLLFDFGSTKLPTGADGGHMKLIADDIATQSGGKLHVVVASHRHADHISGFGHSAAGPVIQGLQPELVVQPWTEAPDLQVDALAPTVGGQDGSGHLALSRRLANMHQFAAGAMAEGQRLGSLSGFPVSLAQRLSFLGETNLKNDAAVRRLMNLAVRKQIYAKFGDTLPVDDLLPGVRIDVLGPPTLQQAPSIASEARKDADEFWHVAARWGLDAAGGAPPSDGVAARPAPLFPSSGLAQVPQAAKWLVPQISRAYADDMLSILRIMDDILNNTSLILLMQIGNTMLLFPGDAQIENWGWALFDSPNAAEIRQHLRGVDVYKVGHHGSLNATPKTLWNGFVHRQDEANADDTRLITVMSTKSGKHGDYHRGTEVPRTKLVEALDLDSRLFSTRLMRSLTKPWRDVEIPVR